jgi:chloramphenicol 3-O-phosphotransferase
MESRPKVVLVTGMQAAGKSTIAPLLAARLGPPAATLDGDVFYNGVVAGAAPMTPEPSAEAVRQLELRYDAGALIAQHYADAGFDFVCSDIILSEHVERWFGRLRGVTPYLVVLVPSVESIVERELARRRQQLVPRLGRVAGRRGAGAADRAAGHPAARALAGHDRPAADRHGRRDPDEARRRALVTQVAWVSWTSWSTIGVIGQSAG